MSEQYIKLSEVALQKELGDLVGESIETTLNQVLDLQADQSDQHPPVRSD